MKVLLINPAWKIGNKGNIWRRVASRYPSLGLAYVASVLEQDGHEVYFLDMHAEGLSPEDVAGLIKRERFTDLDYVGITATTPLILPAFEVARIFKAECPDITVVFGGVHPTVLPDEVLEKESVDVVVRGEGELTARELINGTALKHIKGISYRDNGKVIHNPERPYIENLDDLPPPAFHLMPIEKYRPAVGAYKRLPAMSLFATRGCPGQCTFCYRTFKGKIRSKSGGAIAEEVKILQRDFGIREINFYDDTFTVLKENVREFCEVVLSEDIGITWCCFSRANYVDKELLKLMKEAGCHQVMMGFESGVQEVLDGMNKMITLDQIKNAAMVCKEVGLEVRAAYIFGNIGETAEMMQATLDFAKKLDTDYAQFNVLTAYPGTEVWRTAKKNDWLRVDDYNYSVSDLTLELPTATQQEILDIYGKSHREYYLRLKLILRRLLKIRSFSQIKMEIRGALAVVFNVE